MIAPYIVNVAQANVLNLPVAVFQQNDRGSIFFDAGNRDVLGADHEINVDERIVHAQFAVSSLRSVAPFRFSCRQPQGEVAGGVLVKRCFEQYAGIADRRLSYQRNFTQPFSAFIHIEQVN